MKRTASDQYGTDWKQEENHNAKYFPMQALLFLFQLAFWLVNFFLYYLGNIGSSTFHIMQKAALLATQECSLGTGKCSCCVV